MSPTTYRGMPNLDANLWSITIASIYKKKSKTVALLIGWCISYGLTNQPCEKTNGLVPPIICKNRKKN